MDIPRISQVFRTLIPGPDLDKAAEEMAKHPDEAKDDLGSLVEVINNAAHKHGIGFIGRNDFAAGVQLQQFVSGGQASGADVPAPTKKDFALLLTHMGQLEKGFRQQLETHSAGGDPIRRELLRKMVSQTVSLQNFRGPKE